MSSFSRAVGVDNAFRYVVQEAARWTQGTLTRSMNEGDQKGISECLTSGVRLTVQGAGERPHVVKGNVNVVEFLGREREALRAAGVADARYTLSDHVVVTEASNVVVESQYFVVAGPAGGLYGGVVRSGTVQDVYTPSLHSRTGPVRMELESRTITSDQPFGVEPAASSA